ncbi:MAG: sulfurtransferase TusA family protein [Nitrospinaceae bacterium]|jgi:tRNA 2-thiouridine synthesizing protein A|nr:sulfurtransferase TusA family protein [Nitrospinaceae bacterium]MBT3433866.1 sulfurtransferase TusA family protein [Nitrospinaceae bacterium]MBT3820394.1 sulfurtransferase TusA family protein [Nitrospinaceae bacterium]MBT4095432.1 sulfurtransferase TusA family protein [Nitrospinaceae bacterium]MBT4429007.1 sulfurtransferase TusA family protein [Nitrospinaceae bacterium]
MPFINSRERRPTLKPDKTLNLLGEICPMTWVRTKLAIEEMGSGELLEVWLDEGEPSTSVPQSAEAEGVKHVSSTSGPEGGVAVQLKLP